MTLANAAPAAPPTTPEALHALLREITVLALEESGYVEHGVFTPGDTATSRLLAGFAVDVTALFDAPGSGA